MAWFRVTLEIGIANDAIVEDFEIPDKDFEGLDESARQALVDEAGSDLVGNHVSWGVDTIDCEGGDYIA